MIYVPGDLFSVNPTTARGVPAYLREMNAFVCFLDLLQVHLY
jgi:phosphatidylserine decarboxylase